MSTFEVFPIANHIVQAIRQTMRDDAGHVLQKSIATEQGYGPCRSCLRQFRAGEERILFSYTSLSKRTPFDEAGPVYVHAAPCTPYASGGEFPEEIKAGPHHIPISLRAYNEACFMVGTAMVQSEVVEDEIELFFANSVVAEIQIRNSEAGCFIGHVRRKL